jgi:hypothetical protein
MADGMDEVDLLLPPQCCVDLTRADSRLPRRWAVLLLADESGRPVQLVCWKNPRHTMADRLTPDPDQSASWRVDWRSLVRTVSWRPVDSAFEADWVYLETARRVFPDTCRELVPWTETFFLRVDPDEPFPRYLRTADPAGDASRIIGPLPDKQSAARLIELIEDLFDLCRYHNILTQSPRGKACAYKDMGKCPAPCDGGISMEQYRRLIELSLAGLADPNALIAEHALRMEQAAAGLRFESATKIKAHLNQLAQLQKGAFRYARPLTQFEFLAIQPGPRRGKMKMFLVLPGYIEPAACLRGEPTDAGELIDAILRRRREITPQPMMPDRIGLVARHLFDPKPGGGVFLPLSDLTPHAILSACRHLSGPARPTADKDAIG